MRESSRKAGVGIVRVSRRYQIVIPRDVRKAMNLRPGQKVAVFQIGQLIEVVPVPKMSEMRGVTKGIDTTVKRDRDRL